jgi:uncharacterized protein (TIGR03086 family)
MTEDPFILFDRAAAVAEAAIAAVKPDQFDNPTPCPDWTVRQLVNHVVTGNKLFAALVTGGSRPDRSADHLGTDPLGAFRATVREVRAAFATDGALERTYVLPIGPVRGAFALRMRVNEMFIHAWDVARATGQSTDLDPEMAEQVLAVFRAAPVIPRGPGKAFGEEQPVPAHASAADRVAAFAGRTV